MERPVTIRAVIDRILSEVPGAPLPDTVDTVKRGDASQPVTGIVTTFLATYQVIQRAAELGANLIITHEPTFYNHLDETAWLDGDPVYAAKTRLLDEHGIVVWRFHDHWHLHRPDGIFTGVLAALGWESTVVADDSWATTGRGQQFLRAMGMEPSDGPPRTFLCEIAPTSLADLTNMLKARLGIDTVRVAGPDDLICRRVWLMPGSPPGHFQIGAVGRDDVDVIVVGEINEWETSEYVRDSQHTDRPRGLIILGHASSEEPGMRWLVDWLQPKLPGVTITHVPAGNALRSV